VGGTAAGEATAGVGAGTEGSSLKSSGSAKGPLVALMPGAAFVVGMAGGSSRTARGAAGVAATGVSVVFAPTASGAVGVSVLVDG